MNFYFSSISNLMYFYLLKLYKFSPLIYFQNSSVDPFWVELILHLCADNRVATKHEKASPAVPSSLCKHTSVRASGNGAARCITGFHDR